MKTSTSQMEVRTWLPIFSGFYGTIWETENDEQCELDRINQERKEKGWKEVDYNDVDWAYKAYKRNVVKGMTNHVGEYLKKGGFILNYSSQQLVSPREYNFVNDSINVSFDLSDSNRVNIKAYLDAHKEEFSQYIRDRYTSYDGFISSHSNNAEKWMEELDTCLTDTHKLGSILNFIITNEESEFENDVYGDITGNGAHLYALNYEKLTTTEVK